MPLSGSELRVDANVHVTFGSIPRCLLYFRLYRSNETDKVAILENVSQFQQEVHRVKSPFPASDIVFLEGQISLKASVLQRVQVDIRFGRLWHTSMISYKFYYVLATVETTTSSWTRSKLLTTANRSDTRLSAYHIGLALHKTPPIVRLISHKPNHEESKDE